MVKRYMFSVWIAVLAALISGRVSLPRGSTVVCVLGGGNSDRERLKSLL